MADDQLPSLLPQRWPAVRAILEDLDRALNHLADGPGNTIVTLWPQLRLEFWRAASLISASDAYRQSSASASSAPPATIFSVFYDDYDEVKANANLLQRFTKAAQDLGCSAYDMFLDFGPAIAKSTHALQKISRAFYYNPGTLTRDAVVRALQAETLARPDLRPDQAPPPPLASSPGPSTSRATSAVPPSPADAAAASPAHRLALPRPASKRAAEAITSTAAASMGPPPPKKRKTTAAANDKADDENDGNNNDDDDDDDDDDDNDEAEAGRRASGRSSLSSSWMRESSSVVQTPMSDRGGHGSGMGMGVGSGLGPGNSEEETDEDDAAKYVALCRQILAVGGGRAPKVKDPELRGAVRSLRASADVVVTLQQQQQQQ
ncbi:hypothetical protein Ct61P_15088 [Colletotrichum tofieldiae]|nr:hypothetical protein Ct61P_15088 [Colletotrichum tofieldiae]